MKRKILSRKAQCKYAAQGRNLSQQARYLVPTVFVKTRYTAYERDTPQTPNLNKKKSKITEASEVKKAGNCFFFSPGK
jgi:tRNA U54 and U55 pseudouridine synthase Pus10